jgi:hypothetical protein
MALVVVMSCLWTATALAQPVEVDQAEVLRMGDLVQHIDGIRSDGADGFVEAMAPPATDADKWHISVLSMQGCPACQKLKTEWTTNAWLLALANPNDPKQSWAHYNVYLREDRSQAFRFENLKVTTYPTIIVQPPRSGRYGDARTVVFQAAYGGDPERLARDITTAIRRYVAKFEASQPPRQAPHRAPEGSIGVDPPWQPAPQVDPPLPNVTPVFPDGRPLIPPSPAPDSMVQPTGLWGTVGAVAATSLLTLLLTLGVPWALRTYRQHRIDSGQRPLLTDEQFQKLVETLSAAASVQNVRSAKTDHSDAATEPSRT